MLKPWMIEGRLEAGCDEAGRGSLAGPVMAAAVVLPPDCNDARLDDSKRLTAHQREALRRDIESYALCWAVASVSAEEIDRINILHASTHAMCLAVGGLMGNGNGCIARGGTTLGQRQPEHLLVDGNRFYNETPLGYDCIVGGDAKYMSIAAASILAKTYRDEHMLQLHTQCPQYRWDSNKGYPTEAHYLALEAHGPSLHHRRTFKLYRQHTLFE